MAEVADNGGDPIHELEVKLVAFHASLIGEERNHLCFIAPRPNELRAVVALCGDQVEIVTFTGDVWRDRDIAELQKLNRLSTLALNLCGRLTDEALLHISKIKSLQTLDLSSVSSKKFTLTGFKMLSRLPSLDLLKLPMGMTYTTMSWEDRKSFLATLKATLPNTIIKD